MSKELIPCPFCQKEKAILLTTKNSIFEPFVEEGIAYHVMCTECGASTRKCYTKEQAIKAWNRRPSPWHTGTPTEDGMYVIFFEAGIYKLAEFVYDNFSWVGTNAKVYYTKPENVKKWQKIEP